MRSVQLRLLCCSVFTLYLVSCAVAQDHPEDKASDSLATLETFSQPIEDMPTSGTLIEGLPATSVGRLADIERLAFKTNPAIAKAHAKRDALTGKRIQAGLGPNPKAGFFGEDLFEDGSGGRYGFFYGQEVVRGNKLALSQNVVDAEIYAACQQIEILERRLKTDVQNQFYEVLLAQQRATLTESLAQRLAEILKISEALVEAKEAAAASVLQVEIEYEQIKVVAKQANLDLAAARQLLAAFINESVLPFERLDGDVATVPSLPTIEEVYDSLLANSPEIAAELAKIETAERTWNQGNIRKARSEIVIASASVEQKVIQLRQRLIKNYRDYAKAKLHVDAFANSILPKSEKSLELITDGYRSGELNFLQVLTAQRTYFQAQLEYLDRLKTLRAQAILVEGQLLNASLK